MFSIFAFAVVLAVEGEGAAARDLAVAFRLLTSPAVERAEHRSGTRGEEAHVFERSELCAVPSFREERREPAGVARRIASRPCFLLGTFSLHEQRKVTRSRAAGVEALDLALASAFALLCAVAFAEKPRQKQS